MNPSERRFQDTVAAYQQYRLDYPPRLVARLIALTGLKPGDAMLDLGCGPGNLALAFARSGMAVTAMDPEPEMLAAAEGAARAEGLSIRLVRGAAADLREGDGPFRLVTIGRAFHWMDRAATLAMLDRIIPPGGGVALFHDAHPPVEENGWFRVMGRIREKYGRAQLAHLKQRGEGGHRRYEPYLFASAFRCLDGLSVTLRAPITEEQILGRALSTSVCSRQALGGRLDAFQADLRAALRELSPDGTFIEVAEMVALLARRPE